MKQYTIYVCETCGLETKNYKEMRQHEAEHLGLTIDEMESYHALKSRAEHMGAVIASRNNEETRKMFDEAIEKLLAFEKEHGLIQNNASDICEWTFVGNPSIAPYKTSCGYKGAYDNRHEYCPYCIKKIKLN